MVLFQGKRQWHNSQNSTVKASLSISDIKTSSVFWGSLLFRITLDIIYPLLIQPQYGSHGYIWSPDLLRYILSYATLIILLLTLLPLISTKKPSSIVVFMLFTLAYIPNMALFAGMSLPYKFFLLSNMYWICFLLFYRYIGVWHVKPHKNIPSHQHGLREYYVILIVLVIVCGFSIWYNDGIKLTIDFNDVYSLRMDARARGTSDMIKRVLPWAANIVLPVGIIMSIRDRKWLFTCLFVMGVIFAFSVNGTKAWLFICVLSLVMATFIREDRHIGLLPLTLAISNILGYALGSIFNLNIINNYITRRMFFSTSLTNYFWIDFFQENHKLFLTNSSLGWIYRLGIEKPYDTNISLIIGSTYYGNPDATAASGTIAYAYANFGVIGVLIFPLLLVVILKLMDKVCYGSKLLYLYPIIVTTAVYSLNGGTFGLLVNYGYIAGLVFLWYTMRKRDLSI